MLPFLVVNSRGNHGGIAPQDAALLGGQQPGQPRGDCPYRPTGCICQSEMDPLGSGALL